MHGSSSRKPRFYLYNGSFDPPGNHNIQIAKALVDHCQRGDLVWVLPYGGRPGTRGIASAKDRREMILCVFSEIPEVITDFSDIDKRQFAHNIDLERHYHKIHTGHEIWHVIGSDMIAGGQNGQSKIQLKWKEGEWVFANLHFLVLERRDFPSIEEDLPPHSERLLTFATGTNAEIRERVRTGQPIDDLVPASVAHYIRTRKLYQGMSH